MYTSLEFDFSLQDFHTEGHQGLLLALLLMPPKLSHETD